MGRRQTSHAMSEEQHGLCSESLALECDSSSATYLPGDHGHMCFSFLAGESGGENPCFTGVS